MRPDVRFVNDLQEFCCHFRSQPSLHHQPLWQRTDWLDEPGHDILSWMLRKLLFLGRRVPVKKKDSLHNWRRLRRLPGAEDHKHKCSFRHMKNLRFIKKSSWGYSWNYTAVSNLDTMRRWNLPTWGPKPCCACASIGVFETCQGLLGWISRLICQGLPGLEKDSFNICHCNHPHLLITEPGWFKGESFATKSMAKHLLLIGQSRKDWTNQSNDSNQEKSIYALNLAFEISFSHYHCSVA